MILYIKSFRGVLIPCFFPIFDTAPLIKSEIDFISGAVSKIGKKHGVKTPLNDLMYKIIKIKEGKYI